MSAPALITALGDTVFLSFNYIAPPPATGSMLLEDGTDMLLEDGTTMLLES